jgi:SsrA-binding protein
MAAAADTAQAGRVATNRKAFHEYVVLDRIEAGIELQGTEVKSVRTGNVTLTGGYARIENGQVTLHDVHIAPYACGNRFNHEPTRPRRLLLKQKEIDRLTSQVQQKGCALVPLTLYFRRNRWAKIELGICKGKQDADKRESLKRKTADLEARRAVRRDH